MSGTGWGGRSVRNPLSGRRVRSWVGEPGIVRDKAWGVGGSAGGMGTYILNPRCWIYGGNCLRANRIGFPINVSNV